MATAPAKPKRIRPREERGGWWTTAEVANELGVSDDTVLLGIKPDANKQVSFPLLKAQHRGNKIVYTRFSVERQQIQIERNGIRFPKRQITRQGSADNGFSRNEINHRS